MTNTSEFKIALLRSGMTAYELADSVGMSRQSLSYKINNVREFTATEIAKIADVLNLTVAEKEKIFFDNQVDETSTQENG